MKTEIISVSSVLINIAKAIQEDSDLNALAQRYFSRGLLVAVGSYPEGILSEEDAPFVIVRTDDRDSDISTGDIKTLSVMIVLACAPTRDVPSTDNAISTANFALSRIKVYLPFVNDDNTEVIKVYEMVERCGTAEEVASVKAAVLAARQGMTSAKESCETAIEEAEAYALDLDVANVLTKLALAIESANTFVTQYTAYNAAVLTVCDIAERRGVEHDDITEVYSNTLIRIRVATESIAPATAARTALATKWEEYETSPYIKETTTERTSSAGGLVVYGAVNLIDGFRRAIYKVLRDTDPGVPLQEVTFKNNSTSHQPLDWLEISATFGEVQTLL